MDFVIALLETQKKTIEKDLKKSGLMLKNITAASRELYKVSELKKAIKLLKLHSKTEKPTKVRCQNKQRNSF